MHRLARLDRRYIWHPFTQMQDWLKREPIVIVAGRGAVLRDAKGREYLDANSSIWTNLHGHCHPAINRAVGRQLRLIAHSSALGLANEPASLLAERLVRVANPRAMRANLGAQRRATQPGKSVQTGGSVDKVFFSDDGATAVEVALKLAYEVSRRSGRSPRPGFLSLLAGYHGDTVGAVALGHIDLFHKSYAGLLFKSDAAMSPYCYRCPFNRATPERADARDYRQCNWECIGRVEQKFVARKQRGNPYSAFVFEPLVQGAAGIIPQPTGWLRQVTEIAQANGALLIADEVLTAFGRATTAPNTLFACHQEAVQPDLLCLAKGLTGGYLPMAATLTTRGIFEAFLGRYQEFKTFFHGHSYTANQLGAAAALANLGLLQSQVSVRARARLQKSLREELASLWSLPHIGDIRQIGLIAGVELVADWRTRRPFDLRQRVGMRVCEAMARRGVLTRPIGNVVVLMPPFCTTPAQVRRIITVLREAIEEVMPGKSPP